MTTYASTKNHVYNEDLTPFYKITFSSPKNNHFHSNVIKFVLGSIQKFDTIIEKIKNQMDETPSSIRRELKARHLIKFIIKENKDRSPLRYISKKSMMK